MANTGTGEAVKKAINKTDENTEKLSENLQNQGTELKEKFDGAVSAGSDAVQKVKESAQNFVSDKKEQISTYAHQAYDKAGELGNRASEALSSSADYVRNIDVDKARDAVKNTVQDKPELSIVIAALTGLVIGLVIGRTGKK